MCAPNKGETTILQNRDRKSDLDLIKLSFVHDSNIMKWGDYVYSLWSTYDMVIMYAAGCARIINCQWFYAATQLIAKHIEKILRWLWVLDNGELIGNDELLRNSKLLNNAISRDMHKKN